MEKKKSKLPLNKILTISTLVLPTFVYLIINTLFFSITPDVIFHDVEKDDLRGVLYEVDKYFVYAEKEAYSVSGDDITYDMGNKLGVVVTKDTIINVGTKYYRYDLVKIENEDGTFKEEMQFVDVKVELIKQKTSYAIPISMMVTIIGALIASLVVFKKMHYAYRYPKFSVLITLCVITGVLGLINLVVGSLFGVFTVFTISWAIYMIECAIIDGKLGEQEANKAQSKLMQELARASQMFK